MPEAPAFNTARAEIRALVDRAKRDGRRITSQIIWGSLEREVPEDSFVTLLSSMCGSHQLTKVPITDAPSKRGGHACYYEPGPVEVKDGKRRERCSRAMGFMAHKRLVDAREAARVWNAGR